MNTPRIIPRLLSSLLLLTVLPVMGDAVDPAQQSITIALTQEPPNLNSMRSTDLVSYFILGHVNEGLLRFDRRGRLAPGVAESWSVTSTRMMFKLRAGGQWSDGSPLTAHDFVFAWRKVNDPAEATPFAAIMYPIKNAEAVQQGKLPVNRLGVHALDDLTLAVELERPCGYCLSLMAHGVFYPVQAAFFNQQGAQYGAEARHLLANGPFRLTRWVHEASLTLEKNPRYWNAGAINLNRIQVSYITSDNRTRLNLFRDEQIALVRLGAETVQDAVNEGLRLRTFLSGGVAFIWFNMRPGRPTSNLLLRRAIQAAFDPDVFVNQVVAIPGYKPTNTLFPSWLGGVQGKFVDEFPPVVLPGGAKVAAGLMAQARAQMDELPPIVLLTVASPTGAKTAEYLQGLFQRLLGLKVRVDQQSFKQYLNKVRGGQFDLAISSWYPDFDDIVTYADLLGSYNANNRGGYVNPVYDRWLTRLQTSSKRVDRYGAAAELQQIIAQDIPILPLAETGSAYLQHPGLRGVVRSVLGPDPDYTHARVIRPSD